MIQDLSLEVAMKTIRTAVIGVGYLGQYHAEKYASIPHSELVAVSDTDKNRCQTIADNCNTLAISDYTTLVGKVDAVSIAVPTQHHFSVAEFFLSHGIHVLVEKPITTTIEQADILIALAKKNNCLLQVGHLERYNNVICGLDAILDHPRFIESTRLSPFKLRGSDVNVVLDLMIHDIDIIQAIVPASIERISASGASVLSPFIDIANARIEFENGCVANVTASRINLTTERTMRIFQHDAYISLDLNKKRLNIHKKSDKEMYPGVPEITRDKHFFDKGDALKDQIEDFLDSILHHRKPRVSGEDGKRALEIAIEITDKVHQANEKNPIKR